MKILHTADLHLKILHDERWTTLQGLLQIGKKEKINLFLICGDLFDGEKESEQLRPHIRSLFTGNGFSIVILPGNHDHNSYKEGKYYGEDVSVITDVNDQFCIDDVVVGGLPFERSSKEGLLQKLHLIKRRFDPKKKNILLFHGELLDSFFSRGDFGNEGNERYMPVKLSYFKDIPAMYVLAGHFHRNFDVRTLPDGKFFVYPGSPVSVTKRETGRRRVNIFNMGEPPTECFLDSFHYEELNIELDPYKVADPVLLVKERLTTVHPESRILVTIKGYINSSMTEAQERDIAAQFDEVLKERSEERFYEFRDIRTVLEDEIWIRFLDKLEHGNYGAERKKRLQSIAIRAMMEAGI
jgi:exonuclease SbcD